MSLQSSGSPETLPFVGSDRHELVEHLYGRFLQVAEEKSVSWTAISAPTGWGKTRIVHEFYERLASTCQEGAPYWPPTLFGVGAGAEGAPLQRYRKVVAPRVRHQPGSLPDYMWWGITCSAGNGVPSIALANDLRQLVAHGPYLEDAIAERRGRRGRAVASLKAVAGALIDVGSEEAVNRVAEEILSSIAPGFGLIGNLANRARGARRDARDRRERRDGTAEVGGDADLVAGAVSLMSRVATTLPIVMVIEDFHDADTALCELLEAVTARNDLAVLIITTSWPGHDRQMNAQWSVLETAGRGPIHLDLVTSTPGSAGRAPSKVFHPLPTDDVVSLIDVRFPGTDRALAVEVAQRCRTPLAVELVSSLPKYERLRGHALDLSPDEVAGIPVDLSTLYRDAWASLPTHLRRGLVCAALATPVGLTRLAATPNPVLSAAEWSETVLTNTLEALEPGAEVDDSQPMTSPASAMVSAASYAWTAALSADLRVFGDPVQMEIAHGDIAHFLRRADRDEFIDALVAQTERFSLGALDDVDEDSRLHRARLVLALHALGRSPSRPLVVWATVAILRNVSALPSAWNDVLHTARSVIRTGPDEGLSDDEVMLRLLVERLELHNGSRPADVGARLNALERGGAAALATRLDLEAERQHLLALASWQANKPDQAITAARAAAQTRRSLFGEAHLDTLRSRYNLAVFLYETDDVEAARHELLDVETCAADLFGSGHIVTLTVATGRALCLQRSDQVADALALLDVVVARAVASHGENAPISLMVRYNRAVAQARKGVSNDARNELLALSRLVPVVFGPSHPLTQEVMESMSEDQSDWDSYTPFLGMRRPGH